MKNVFLFLLLEVIAKCLIAQSSNQYLGNYVQPAPNAASLGKYVDYPIGYYTGTPEISIPLFNLSDGAVKVPISLSYHASGIRVSEVASWVGLGWALNAGGMIIRTVKGGPDEGVGNPQFVPRGYFLDSGLRKMPNLLPAPDGNIIPVGTNEYNSQRYGFLQSVSAGGSDSEPDLFTFNVNGYSGKFVFDEYRNPQLLSQQDLKISVNYASGDFQSWVIITPDGAKYYFGENGMHEVNKVYYKGPLDANSLRPSSWYLTKIIYPNTKDTVLFSYTPETYSYCDLGQETTLYDQSNGTNNPRAACAEDLLPPMNSLKTIVDGLRLTAIKSRNYFISFIAKNQRQDLDLNPLELDSVKIFNSKNECLKQYLLSYNYFTSTSATGASAGAMQVTNGSLADTKRLKLVAVKEFSGDGVVSKPPYTINYQETKQLPRRMSYDQDHWGFSSNESGNAKDRFTPSVTHSICFSTSYFYRTRDSKWPDMEACTIKGVIDPLGVVTSFEFEAHTSNQLINSTNIIGGLRIHKIKTVDGVTGDSTVRLFDYGAGGVLYNTPTYLVEPHNEYYYSGFQDFASYTGYGYQEMQTLRSLLKQSQSVVPLQDLQGNHIGYSNVKEIFGPHGEGGYKIHYFLGDQLFDNSRLSLDNYTQLATVQNTISGSNASFVTGIFGNGHFNDISPANLVYSSRYYAHNYWPLAPEQVDFRRGQQLSEETYDSSGNLLQSEYNEYKQTYDESKWIRGFKLFRSFKSLTLVQNLGSFSGYNDAMTYYKLHTGISHLVKKTVKNYKDGKTFTTVTRIGYESAYHTLQTSDTTVNSIGDSIINKTYYSFDYLNTVTADNVIGKLKARNMLVPVSTRVWKNNKLTSGTITSFKDFAASSTDTLISPQKIMSLDVTNTLTTAQAGETIQLNGLLTSLVPNTYFIEKANFGYDSITGKIFEQRLMNDKTQALIWDDQLSLPLATIDNASASDVAYNSFETAETGNWIYPAGSAVAEPTAPTGNRAYTLTATALSKNKLVVGKQYILSYWGKSSPSVSIAGGTQSNAITGSTINTNWTYKQVTLTATATTFNITGTGIIDEVRLYPATAQMTTYTYDSLLRLIEQCSVNNQISQYEYDSFNRLTDIKDQYGNVLKAFEYNYGGLSR